MTIQPSSKDEVFHLLASENNTQSTQPLHEDLDEDIEDEDESTTSSEKPPSRSMTNTSTSKRRAKCDPLLKTKQ